MNFGEKLKDLRTQKGWSQEELAKQMGVTRRTIGGYEAGTTYPRTRDMYAKLAELLETDVNYLMTENEEFMTEVGSFYGGAVRLRPARFSARLVSYSPAVLFRRKIRRRLPLKCSGSLWIPRRWHVKSSRRRNTGRMPKMTAPDLLPESW